MNLYVVRHAEAVKVGGAIRRDADRRLTGDGEKDAALIGRVLRVVDPGLALVITSPLVRAVQTGEIIGKEISKHTAPSVSENLAPGFDPGLLLQELMTISNGGSVVAVGHQPDMSMFISFLISGSRTSAIAMAPCSTAGINLAPHPSGLEARLMWLLSPQTVRSLYPKP